MADSERREIYQDVIHNLGKREKEQAKLLRKKNAERLADILDQMTKVRLLNFAISCFPDFIS